MFEQVMAMVFAPSDMILMSPAFPDRGKIPLRHSGDGDDLSPPLAWKDVPEKARSLALVCHDPDAPLVIEGAYGFVHWVLYNIPATEKGLPEGCQDFTVGRNDAGGQGYVGPKPPEGHGQHHYFIWLLALSEDLELHPGLTMWELMAEIEPHLIGMNRLVGVYER